MCPAEGEGRAEGGPSLSFYSLATCRRQSDAAATATSNSTFFSFYFLVALIHHCRALREDVHAQVRVPAFQRRSGLLPPPHTPCVCVCVRVCTPLGCPCYKEEDVRDRERRTCASRLAFVLLMPPFCGLLLPRPCAGSSPFFSTTLVVFARSLR